MAVEETRRVALHRAAAESWGEEIADTLVELVAPSGHELATRQDIEGVLAAMNAMDERIDERITALERLWEERFTASEQLWLARFTASERRWDERFAALERRWDVQFVESERRWDEIDTRWQVESRALRHELTGTFERRMNEAITHSTHQTRMLMATVMVAFASVAGVVVATQ